MAKKKVAQNSQAAESTGTTIGCLMLTIALIGGVVYMCSGDDDDDVKTADTTENRQMSVESMRSAGFVHEVHAAVFNKDGKQNEIRDMSLNEILEIHTYLNVQRWNAGGDIERRGGTDYQEAAEDLNIPVAKLEAADKYYHYTIFPELSTAIKALYKDYPNVGLDHYGALGESAYCGTATVIADITVYGQKSTMDFKTEAKNVAQLLMNDLPAWVTGFKLKHTYYEDTVLQTHGPVDVGFLWRRGEEMETRRSAGGLENLRRSDQNSAWGSEPWNNLKVIKHPEYVYLTRSN